MAWLTPQLDIYLQIRKNRVEGHTSKLVIGHFNTITVSESTIWPEGGLISYPSSAAQLNVSSTSVLDTSAGTGARTLQIIGLDTNYDIISEIVSLNGLTAVTTTNSYLRVNELNVMTAGSLGANQGNIYIGEGLVTLGKPATIYNVCGTNCNRSHSAAFTVPNGFSYYMVYGLASSSVDTTITQYARPLGGLFYSLGTTIIGAPRDFHIKGAPGLESGTDFQIRAKSLLTTGTVTFYAEFIEVDNRSG